MLLDEQTVLYLDTIITGDSGVTPYQRGADLVDWFNSYGFNDSYPDAVNECGSRKNYALERAQQLNQDNTKMAAFIESIVDPRKFAFCKSPSDITDVVEAINKLIKFDRYELRNVHDRYQIFQLHSDSPVNSIAIFEDIQNAILTEIQSARFCIWIAIAWFTDEILYDALKEKRKQGVSTKAIILDDNINQKLNFRNFPIKRIPPKGRFQNLMHHKFCVIDLKKVLHGSYNWTTKAQYNDEHLTVSEDRILAEEFATRFVKLAADI